MKLRIIFVSLFSFIQFGYSQNIDSLKQELSFTENDSLRVEILSKISYALEPISLDSTLKYIDQAISLSWEIEDTSLWVKMSNRKAIFYAHKGLYDKSFLVYNQIIEPIFQKDSLNKNLMGIYFNIAYNYYELGKFEDAMKYSFSSKKIAAYHKDTTNLINNLNLLGVVQIQLQEYERAIKTHEEILRYVDPKNVIMISGCYSNLGSSYMNMQKHQQAEFFFQKNLKIHIDYNLDLIEPYSNLASLYSKQKNIEKAEKYFTMAINEANRTSEFIHPFIYLGLAECYIDKKQYEKALVHAQKAKTLSANINNEITLMDQEEVAYTLSKILKKNGKYKEALEEFEYSAHLRDSIFNIERTQQIFNLEAQYKKVEQDAEIALLKKDKEIEIAKTKFNKIVGISAIIGLILASLLAAVLYKLYKQKKTSEKELSAKNVIIVQEKEQAELKALLAQMNPHFISNFLNNLHVAISNNEIKESTKLTTYISKFGKLSRMILEHSNKAKVSINEELTALKLYIELEQLRTNNAFVYNIQLDPSIDQYNLTIPPMLFQPLVENAIWHGVVPLKEKGNIQIALVTEGDVIMCEVRDNGIGLHVEKSKTSDQMSMSTSIVKERLNIIWKGDNPKYGLKIENAKQGTIATFAVPINF